MRETFECLICGRPLETGAHFGDYCDSDCISAMLVQLRERIRALEAAIGAGEVDDV